MQYPGKKLLCQRYLLSCGLIVGNVGTDLKACPYICRFVIARSPPTEGRRGDLIGGVLRLPRFARNDGGERLAIAAAALPNAKL
jgi:hypothetical protein